MLVKARCRARPGLVVLIGASIAALTACSSLDSASSRIAGIVKPYRVDVVQGNFVAREQVQALQPGMSRQQVREILGSPLLTSLFHADRWEYVFTLKRPGEELQARKLTVFFKGDVLDRSEGDAMPGETEFVATLSARAGQERAGQDPAPVLEATPEQLARYPASPRPAKTPASPPPAADSMT
ncbi:outer membrane protein assembly factor BamE, partial [Verminephrobacter eiseniae]